MGFTAFLSEMSPTFLGILVGSLFTTIGVILTNASNTKRLRLQHDHEQFLESKERDVSLRRDTYMSAIEAISAGMVAVGRFGELNIKEEELMHSYSEKSPAIAKVTIVGKDETIKAVTNFNSELLGAFLRLTSYRQSLNVAWERYEALNGKIEMATREQERLQSLMDEHHVKGEKNEAGWDLLRRKSEIERAKLEQYTAEQEQMLKQVMPAHMELIRRCTQEAFALDRLLTQVISRMRAELELPFDEVFYSQIVEENHRKQTESLESFIREQAIATDKQESEG